MIATLPLSRMPVWFLATAAGGVAWNIFGVVQFLGSLTATEADLMAQGMTADQAAVYLAIPAWMTVAFAIGVFGGLAGAILLALRRKAARPVLIASLAGYLVLYAGDITEGVFAAIGMSQVIILSVVVLIAAGLVYAAARAEKAGLIA